LRHVNNLLFTAKRRGYNKEAVNAYTCIQTKGVTVKLINTFPGNMTRPEKEEVKSNLTPYYFSTHNFLHKGTPQ
jgi:hypothetical protein